MLDAEDIKVATFHSHYGAMMFHKRIGGDSEMRPVPRALSSSCGTAVFFTLPFYEKWADENTEAVYEKDGNSWRVIWKR